MFLIPGVRWLGYDGKKQTWWPVFYVTLEINNYLNTGKFYSHIQRGFWYLECVMGVVGVFAHVWEGFAGEVIIELVNDV